MKNKLLVLLLVFFANSCDNNNNKPNIEETIKVGDILDLSGYDLLGIQKGRIEKNKLILIDFWATWCGPCIAGFPHLEKLQEKYSDDLQVIAISDENEKIVKNFLTKRDFNLSFLNDVEKKLFTRFNINQRPISSLISKRGELLWVGSSEDVEQILTLYLNYGILPQIKITELNKLYYNHNTTIEAKDSAIDNYIISEGKNPELYFAKSQKNESEPVDIKYTSVPLTEIILDFLQVNNLNLVNNRPELDSILLNIDARSEKLTYGQVKTKILGDVQNRYNFNIKTKSKNVDVYQLTIIDKDALEKNIETIEGGGMVERKNGQHFITRLSLNQMASYFQKRLKTYVQYEGMNDSKFNLIFGDFKTIDDLNTQVNKAGLVLTKQKKDIEIIEIN